MPTPSAAADTTRIYNELLVTTAEHIHPGILENAIDAHPIASIFFGKVGSVLQGDIGNDGASGGAQEVSGESIRVNVKLGQNETFSWLAGGYDPISMNTDDNLRGTRANHMLGAGSVVISGSQLRKNSGIAQVTSLLREKEEDAVSGSVDKVAQDLLSTSAVANGITSVDTLVSANDAAPRVSG